eukprot:350799-Chlamydomonas_euryale.AAC.4
MAYASTHLQADRQRGPDVVTDDLPHKVKARGSHVDVSVRVVFHQARLLDRAEHHRVDRVVGDLQRSGKNGVCV